MSEPLAVPPPPAPPAVPAVPPAAVPVRVTGLSCPSCGGVLEVEAGARVVTCPYCTKTLLATARAGVRRFAVEPGVDGAAAHEQVRRWLGSGWNKHGDLPRRAELAETFLCFLPFFRVEADVVGAALGTEKRRRTVGSGKNRRTETYEVDVERTTETSAEATFPALNVAEWGVEQVILHGDHLVPFDAEALERRGMVFPPTRSEAAAFQAALAEFRQQNDPGKGLERVRFRFLETVRERLTVVYYPLWLVRYHFRGRAYQVLVDAEDGTLAFGKAPGNALYRAVVLVAAEAALCFAGSMLLHHAGDAAGALAVVGAVGALLLAWAWKRFRYGGVVEEGSGIRRRPARLGRLLGGLAKGDLAAMRRGG
ncbi:MAG TPA: hypothetical protein VHQ65_08500 [Thermoanaerobaculia bacterium]|nr:hypothetical protein [Thermoanaerobaculia bacterium]